MRLALLLVLLASLAHADALPDVVFETAQVHVSTITLHDGRVLSGTITRYDAQHVALTDEASHEVVLLAREDIASVRFGEAPRHVVRHAPRLSLLSKIGLGITGASYGLAVVGGASFMTWNRVEENRGRDAYGPELYTQGGYLFIPLVGPFLSAQSGGGFPSWWQGVWIADGVAQVAGLGVLVAGLVRQHTHAVPLAYRGVTFTPSVTPQSIGFGGTF